MDQNIREMNDSAEYETYFLLDCLIHTLKKMEKLGPLAVPIFRAS
jgi:hypothetical protein